MTTVLFLKRGHAYVGFAAMGHAGYAKSGEDIVCAAVSAVTQSALAGLSSVLGLSVSVRMRPQTGYMRVRLSHVPRIHVHAAQTLLRTLHLYLLALQAEHPGNIRVLVKNGGASL